MCGEIVGKLNNSRDFLYKKTKKTKPERLVFSLFLNGTRRGIRTPDLLVRSQTLYPAGLYAQIVYIYIVRTEKFLSTGFYSLPQNALYINFFAKKKCCFLQQIYLIILGGDLGICVIQACYDTCFILCSLLF